MTYENLSMTGYEAYFFELSRLTMTILLDEVEKIRKFVRRLTFSIMSCMFRVARERESYQSIVSTIKEEKVDGYGRVWVPQEGPIIKLDFGASSEGRGSHKGSSFFQCLHLIHASI